MWKLYKVYGMINASKQVVTAFTSVTMLVLFSTREDTPIIHSVLIRRAPWVTKRV